MKRFLLFTAAVLTAAALSAQTLNVHCGPVTVAVPAGDMGIVYGGRTDTLAIAGVPYAIAEIDSITVTQDDVVPATVFVNYADTAVSVLISGDIAPYVAASCIGTDVTLTADSALMEEVTYVLSGSAVGSFTQTGAYKCTVKLNGLTLTGGSGPAIDIQNGKRISVLLADGTENTLADAAGGLQKACFYVKGHAEFSGGGTLNITGNTRHAYASNEYTSLESVFTGTINVLGAVGDGLNTDQYFEQHSGTVNISGCAGDGIDAGITGNAADELNGQMLISGGSITIDLGAAGDVKGLKCDSTLTLTGGTVRVTGTGAGQKGVKTGTDLFVNSVSGTPPAVSIYLTGGIYHKGELDEAKTRGFKVNRNFTFDGGTIDITAIGNKAKPVVVDQTYTYVSGAINCAVEAASYK